MSLLLDVTLEKTTQMKDLEIKTNRYKLREEEYEQKLTQVG
jgi:hypothetical protein